METFRPVWERVQPPVDMLPPVWEALQSPMDGIPPVWEPAQKQSGYASTKYGITIPGQNLIIP